MRIERSGVNDDAVWSKTALATGNGSARKGHVALPDRLKPAERDEGDLRGACVCHHPYGG